MNQNIKYSTLGNAVINAANANGKTVAQIAQYCDVQPATVRRWLQHTHTMPFYRIYELTAAIAKEPDQYERLIMDLIRAHYDYEFHKRKTRVTK